MEVEMEKSQSKTIHIGNMGEDYLGALLARHCVVRNVGQGKDTGIDLYCEIIRPESLELTLHFFCQVKTRKTKINPARIDDELWAYWGRQPVPVFLFLIRYAEERTLQEDAEVWVYDVPYILAKKDAERDGKTVPTRDVADKFLITKVSNNKDRMTLTDFLYHHVSWSYGLWQMRRLGLVLPNPEVVKQEARVLAGGFSYLYEKKIREAMWWAQLLIAEEHARSFPAGGSLSAV